MTARTAAGLLLAFTLPLAAQQAKVFEPAEAWERPENVRVAPGDLVFRDADTRGFQSRSFYCTGRLDDERLFVINLFRWSFSVFHAWGASVLVTEPDGRTYVYEQRIREAELTEAENHLFIRFDGNELEDTGAELRLRLSLPDFFCDLAFRKLLPSWRPGDGWAPLSSEDYLRFVVVAPWSELKGTMAALGRSGPVRGFGYADSSLHVMPMNRVNSPVYAFRVFSPAQAPPRERWFVSLLRYTTHPEYGSRELPMLLLAQGGRWVFTTRNFSLEPLDPVTDPAVPYPYPTRYAVRCEWQGHRLEGEYIVERLYHYSDVFEKLPRLFRQIASMFLKRPVYFRYQGYFRGSLRRPDGTGAKLELPGEGEYSVLF